MYEKGVDVKLMNAERPNPNAKISNLETRQKANLLIKEEHIFETLLVNHKNEILAPTFLLNFHQIVKTGSYF